MNTIHINKAIAIILSCGTLVSCHTTEKFTVNATPGTEIYAPYNLSQPIGMVPQSGKLKVELSSDIYCGYMFSREPGSELKVPFGVDYKNASRAGTKASFWTGLTLSGVGAGACLVGAIAMAAAGSQDDDDSTTSLAIACGVGGGVALVGLPMILATEQRMKQLAYNYSFSYTKNQYALQDVQLKPLANPDMPKEPSVMTVKPSRKKAISNTPYTNASPLDNKSGNSTSKAKKTRGDFGKNLAGTYDGTGSLKQKGRIIEAYDNISIIITRIDKTTVSVQVVESDEEFFESPSIYDIKRQSDGSFLLTMRDIPSAAIKIAPSGAITYTHNKVNIDNEMYHLTIKAKRQ